MSFPPALKSMYTRGFSARVAKPRSAEAPSLAETQASFVAASIVETINAFKGQFHISASFSNTKSKLLLERGLRFVLRLGGCDVLHQGGGSYSLSMVMEDDDSLVCLIKQTSTQKRTFRCSETSATQSAASGCSEPRSCWLCGSARGRASASGSASEPNVYTLIARTTPTSACTLRLGNPLRASGMEEESLASRLEKLLHALKQENPLHVSRKENPLHASAAAAPRERQPTQKGAQCWESRYPRHCSDCSQTAREDQRRTHTNRSDRYQRKSEGNHNQKGKNQRMKNQEWNR